jgi:outer membrane usher protein
MGRLACRALAAAALALAMTPALALTPPAALTGPNAPKLIPLEVIVNGAKSGTWLLLEREGGLYAPQDAFEE